MSTREYENYKIYNSMEEEVVVKINHVRFKNQNFLQKIKIYLENSKIEN